MKSRKTILAVLYVIIAAVVVFTVVSTKGFGLLKKSTSNVSNWQAVFLTNGQVYFGHLKDQDKQFADLTNIYYLQVAQQADLQPDKSAGTASSSSQSLTLIKLGNELHGPSDEMVINRDQILFIENLKSDSKVVTAINDYIKNPK